MDIHIYKNIFVYHCCCAGHINSSSIKLQMLSFLRDASKSAAPREVLSCTFPRVCVPSLKWTPSTGMPCGKFFSGSWINYSLFEPLLALQCSLHDYLQQPEQKAGALFEMAILHRKAGNAPQGLNALQVRISQCLGK